MAWSMSSLISWAGLPKSQATLRGTGGRSPRSTCAFHCRAAFLVIILVLVHRLQVFRLADLPDGGDARGEDRAKIALADALGHDLLLIFEVLVVTVPVHRLLVAVRVEQEELIIGAHVKTTAFPRRKSGPLPRATTFRLPRTCRTGVARSECHWRPPDLQPPAYMGSAAPWRAALWR